MDDRNGLGDIGVYYIFNVVTNKIYIGSSIHIKKRFHEHKWALDNNKHVNGHLQKSWNKYGEDNFKFGIIDTDFKENDIDSLRKAEQYYIDYFESYNSEFGYNISKFASGSGGYEVSETTRQKLREASTGRKFTEEQKRRMSVTRMGKLNGFYGKKHSEEAKEKMRKAAKNRTVTDRQLAGLEFGRGTKAYTDKTYQKLKGIHAGEKSPTAKLSESDVINILRMLKNNEKYTTISSKYNISITQISRIKHKERWGYLYEKYPELYT